MGDRLLSSAVLVLLVFPAVLSGCARATPDGFDALAPEGRIDAIVRTARDRDHRHIPQLISQLDSDDPAVRMFAIRALERLTGETRGYDHAAPERERMAAASRWADWAREHGHAPARQGALRDPSTNREEQGEGDGSS